MSENEKPQGADETAPQTPEERGQQIGATLAAAEEAEARRAATPAGEQADRKTHRGVIIAVVAFAVLLIGAGVAYNALAPGAEPSLSGGNVVTTTEVPTDDTDPNGNGANAAEVGTTEADADDTNATAAPEFTMSDAEGQTLTLADFRGKPVLLNFWASWCDPCTSEMPAIQDAFQKYGDQVQFVAVNMTGMGGETEAAASALIQQNGYTFPVYYDVDNSAAVAFGVTSIPQTYLIDADGNIVAGVRGAMSESVLEEGIQMLTDGATS
ncbi:TlpA disulfide reductase family protein [Adlercreutzia sp. R21]|uniref:TlpA family protein disulfide reductase n=1 Tax=Adlercreutzia wanghongyangiae TaxID=3111451 RepID=UPI002DBCBE88|nr:TlpA disulfide reductase family protein [Adlercreutzia sp. R21]MEC4184896.1 TlpA disulfide reductase family protein [Adlercreutzia sp. R21]